MLQKVKKEVEEKNVLVIQEYRSIAEINQRLVENNYDESTSDTCVCVCGIPNILVIVALCRGGPQYLKSLREGCKSMLERYIRAIAIAIYYTAELTEVISSAHFLLLVI